MGLGPWMCVAVGVEDNDVAVLRCAFEDFVVLPFAVRDHFLNLNALARVIRRRLGMNGHSVHLGTLDLEAVFERM